MGNSATKEQRQAQSRPSGSRHHSSSGPAAVGAGLAPLGRQASPIYSSRPARGSRPDLTSFLGIGGSSNRDEAPAETRRETKQEREARRLEKERIAREKERERSIREESVDGGFLVTQGVYTGPEDFNKAIIERRLAPFWKGLNDHSDSWTEHQLVAAARGLPLPAADDIPAEFASRSTTNVSDPHASEQPKNTLSVPIVARTHSATSDGSQPASSLPNTTSPLLAPSATSPLFRGRSKTLASLTTSKSNSPMDMTPREVHLPKDPYVNGQPVEAYLYKDATECPICFLYYPPYLNKTRCCDQAICSECFVQIKRPDPHPPEHNDNNGGEGREQVEELTLVSEPAACPFCVQPEFGITYEPPPFRKGLVYAHASGVAHGPSAMSSSSSLSSVGAAGDRLSPQGTGRRRTTSLSATSPAVITTDKIRPDWAQKLANARAHAARRSAAATALHTAAYLLNTNSGAESRGFGGFGRRSGLIRRPGASNENVSEARPRDTFGAGGLGGLIQAIDRESGPGNNGNAFEGPSVSLTPARVSSRRSRLEDLEEMMMMEAIRLSLAAEEERKRKEEKEAKKTAKKKEKETRKAEKAAKKGGVYHNAASENASASSIANSPQTNPGVSTSSTVRDSAIQSKGKSVDRPQSNASDAAPLRPSLLSEHSSSSGRLRSGSGNTMSDMSIRGGELPRSHPADTLTPSRPSHLRHVSNTSSSASSFLDSGPGSVRNEFAASNSSFDPTSSTPALNAGGEYDSLGTSTPAGGASSLEPLLNFRSLAAMIGEQEKEEDNAAAVNHAEDPDSQAPAQTELENDTSATPASDEGDLGESVATVKALNPNITAQVSDHNGPTSTSSQA
ncbi:hypothetical protein L228DRAFT_238773 [Xylona heveae TC161]|uniref:Protein sip5 n=1 Tax=Xylona heveae (strain CBS 132557 / TC161) TaxID=1328760 RepID=A0A165H1N0_XYLHT|nr:hypothetical protein L228DRAFT_238773 [Xylona heveae TC161]KZF22871.1 hypothetical protein L228DRAFT_238773 [Xylona heveae TC161]